MILLFSEQFEPSTDKVILWLKHYGKEFIRINDDEKFHVKKIILSEKEIDFELEIENNSIRLSTIESIWVRRSELNINFEIVKAIFSDKEFSSALRKYFNNERDEIEGYLRYKLHEKKCINRFYDYYINKLVILDLAISVGLKIPNTYIINSKENLENLTLPLVTKTIGSFNQLKGKRNYLPIFTEELEKDFIDKLPKEFGFSLIQNKIEKLFELRVFYLENKFYPMAIFSQNDCQTKVDFRKYNDVKPNRTSSFKLPQDLQSKLELLINKTKINSGSIDLIVDMNWDYYFLEINPVGQFEMVSYPCNYFIEREIARYL